MGKNKLFITLLFLIFLLGLCLRLYQLGKYSLWFDEAASLLGTDYINTMVKNAGIFNSVEDRYPCFLFKLFFHYWQYLGKGEFILRIPAVISGALTILAVYLLGSYLLGNKTGLLGALILAVSPFHIYYSREVRMYSMVGLTTVLSAFFLIKALKCNQIRFWFGYVAFNLISIYMHYTSIFILLAQAIFFLAYSIRYRSIFKRWVLANIILFLFLIPWLINMISLLNLATANLDKYYWVPKWINHVSFKNILFTLKNFSSGFNTTGVIYIPLTAIFSFFLISGSLRKEKREETLLLLLCFLIPMLSMYLISKVKPFYTDRYILPSALFYYLLVASGLSRMSNKYSIPIACFVVALSGFGIRNYYADIFPDYKSCLGVVSKKDYKGASRYIMDNFQDGDVIFHTGSDPSSILPLEYYFSAEGSERVKELISKSFLLKYDKKTEKVAPFIFKEQGVKFIDSDISVENQKRIWLVYSAFIFDAKSMHGQLQICNYIEKFYVKKDTREFKEIIIYLYEKK